ncbi:hypothetical protein LSTR_LSTR012228 [Laodelphax striatellus]|uniref:Uncharacterized protein n=1 Tax=Laodelphax striatellus TaxID=195883 RepID=A0A482XHD1_LAOST|nr:hypothetical protein LSTR_LSTR012228 [Laodelphax striatellus]
MTLNDSCFYAINSIVSGVIWRGWERCEKELAGDEKHDENRDIWRGWTEAQNHPTLRGRRADEEEEKFCIILLFCLFFVWRKISFATRAKMFCGSRSLQVLDIRLEHENRDLKPANSHFAPRCEYTMPARKGGFQVRDEVELEDV